MNVVTNSRGVNVRVYSTYPEAATAEVVEPIDAGLVGDEEARQLFDVAAIADAVLEYHVEHINQRRPDGRVGLPLNGYCSALVDDPAEFWELVADHRPDDVEGSES